MFIRCKIRRLEDAIEDARMMAQVFARRAYFNIHEIYNPVQAEASYRLVKEYTDYILERQKEIKQLEAILKLPLRKRFVSWLMGRHGSN